MKRLLLIWMLCLALPVLAQDPEYDDIIKPTFKGGDLTDSAHGSSIVCI